MPSLFCCTMASLRASMRARSTAGAPHAMPCSASPERTSVTCSEDCSSALDGMQPTLVQVPPGAGAPPAVLHASMQTTRRPSCAARIAAMYPPGPAPITATSNSWFICNLSLSDFEQQARRILERFLHGHQRQHRLAPIDDAMVVRQRQVVHGAHDYLAVFHDGPVPCR